MDQLTDATPEGREMGGFTERDFSALREDIGELKTAMRDVAKALERLARVEERQNNVRDDVDLMATTVRNIEARLSSIELAASARKTTSDWVDKGLVGALCLLGLFVAKKLGLA